MSSSRRDFLRKASVVSAGLGTANLALPLRS